MSNVSKEVKDLVIFRLQALPPSIKMSIGSMEGLSKEQLIEHVKDEDEIGQRIIEIQMHFLQSIKTGKIYA